MVNRKLEINFDKSNKPLMGARIEAIKAQFRMSLSAMEKAANIGNGTIKAWYNRAVDDPTNTVEIFLNHFMINRKWWLTGEGEIKESKKGTRGGKDDRMEKTHRSMMAVPFVSQYAYAGYLSGYSDDDYIESLPTVIFPVDEEAKGNYICLEVRGESMDDRSQDGYLEGDLLLCREIDQAHWNNKLHLRKWDFVIVHKTDGILLKRIMDHNIEKQEITIHSLNPEYEDRVIALNDIAKLFNVIKLTRSRKK